MTVSLPSAPEAVSGILGADDYLRKPFKTAEFEIVLERTTRRVELSRQNAWLQRELDDKRRRLEEELARAAEVQASLLPSGDIDILGFEVAGSCRPALDVGGDFYDWMIDGDRLSFILADVMGKGMSAALLMATVRAAFRAGTLDASPAAVVRDAARALESDLMRSHRFVTLFLGVLDLNDGTLRYVDAGHGYGYLVSGGEARRMETGGLPLGVLDDQEYREGHEVLHPGDALIVSSDGVIDVAPGRGDARALPALVEGGAHAAAARLTALPPGLSILSDDMTSLVICRKRGAVM